MKKLMRELKRVEKKQKFSFELSILSFFTAIVVSPTIIFIGFIIGTVYHYFGNPFYRVVDNFFDNLGIGIFKFLIAFSIIMIARLFLLEIKYKAVDREIEAKKVLKHRA